MERCGPWRAKSRRIAVGFVVVWSLAVAGALQTTLQSLRAEDFDGLNNMFQIPFALPWFLLPLPAVTGWSYETDAWTLDRTSLNSPIAADLASCGSVLPPDGGAPERAFWVAMRGPGGTTREH
jgi:hypothetical protein